MENTNPNGKSLSNIIDEAEKEGAKVIVLGEENDAIKNAELISKMRMKHKVILVVATDLLFCDQKRLTEMQKIQKPEPFEPEPFKITKMDEPLPFDFVQDKTKPWQSQRKRSKLKGYSKK